MQIMSELRAKKLASEIQRLIAQKIFELDGMNLITITGVDVSPKYQYAKVFYRPFARSNDSDCRAFIDKNLFLIKKNLFNNLRLKYAINIEFVYDSSFDEAERIENILRQIQPTVTEAEDAKAEVE